MSRASLPLPLLAMTLNAAKLDRVEIPAALFDRLDVNKVGFVSEAELTALWSDFHGPFV